MFRADLFWTVENKVLLSLPHKVIDISDLTGCGLTWECLETQCRSTLSTRLVAALRMMNSLSQAFSELLNPRENNKLGQQFDRIFCHLLTLTKSFARFPSSVVCLGLYVLLCLPWELLCPAAAVAIANAEAGDMVQREFSPDVTARKHGNSETF